jgi:hypothetical protein
VEALSEYTEIVDLDFDSIQRIGSILQGVVSSFAFAIQQSLWATPAQGARSTALAQNE